jgi:transcription elongation factor Elf1
MSTGEIDFTLPLGFMDEKGTIYRNGKMRPATAYDEIVIQDNEKNYANIRYRDVLMLSQVITELGDIKKVGPEVIEELFEMDFIYLQMLYKEINSSHERKAEARCPACGNIDEIKMSELFKDMHFYQTNSDQTEEKKSEQKGTKR